MAGDGNCSREDAIPSDGESQGNGTADSPVGSAPRLEGASNASGDVLEVGGKGELPTAARKAGPGEFDLLKVIGMGAFGKVLQVRSRRNGQILAMKCISKKMLARRNHTTYMQAERDIMTKVVHPFVVALQCAFQTEHKLFLVMEYLPGGELFFHLSKKGLFLEDYAKFYAAEMVLALEFLHGKGIIHRDLKPENLLLGANGHICVTDFGLAKELTHDEDEGLKTICGTNEYMAPEMILRKGYGKAVDWWSMGALVYEMTAGYPPFQGKTPKDLNRKILNERVSLPKWLSPTAHQVLRGFLERNVSRRLGAKKTTMFDIGGATAVKHHPFFEGIDWVKLVALQVEPPLKPELVSTTDTSNFATEFVDMALPRSLSQESLLSHAGSLEPPGSEEVGGMFRGFSFVADSFIEEGDWQQGQGDGFSFAQGGGDGPSAGPPKKVKGKRIRKKGKAKAMQAGASAKAPDVPTESARSEHGNEDRSLPLCGAVREQDVPKPVFVREPVGGVESKPSTLAALLKAQLKDEPPNAAVSKKEPSRANVWGVSSLPAPAPVPIPAGPPQAKGRPSPARRLPTQDSKGLPGHHADASGTFVWKRPV
ncbi:unnamed protein product [Ectocarpus sp. 6 AP-2014]